MSKNGHNSATKSVCWNCGQTLEDHPHPVWGWRRETQNSHRRAPMAKADDRGSWAQPSRFQQWLAECNNPHVIESRAMEALRTAEGNSLKKWQLTKKVRHNDPIRMVNLNRVLADLLAAGRIYCEKRRGGLGRSGELWGLLAQPEADGR